MSGAICDCALYFIPIETRVPLKFGSEVTTSVTCARVHVTVEDAKGRTAEGWGETPLSVHWVWPSTESYEVRHTALKDFCVRLVHAWAAFDATGHPIEVGHAFLEHELPRVRDEFNAGRDAPMPWLGALVCCSAFDIALHDAYGQSLGQPIYALYSADHLSRDLASFIEPADSSVSFAEKYPSDYLVKNAPKSLPAWHLVGGLDPLDPSDLTGDEPDDGHPVLLRDWIVRDGLNCLKIKLRGNDSAWDFDRMLHAGTIALETNVEHLSADFNCTVSDPAYVNEILDRLAVEEPEMFRRILYVEQPFPYDLEENRIDVHSVADRKPLFMDESAHDWRLIRLGRELGWTGVALKTCKTQTGALLSLCWAKAHGMALMVQDLTNPMLAQLPHVQLAAHAGTIMGVETNSMQFYPEASAPEAVVHPGLYQRRNGRVFLSRAETPGFGYRIDEINRALPEAAAEA
ncbi:MAG: hypothetical protein DHS20C16_35060 [Phycisphaerae bacterium]|nr:MAG: hypothetical protein DHS20C16_35060 [Phycisphaerae bacterium]